MLPPAKEILVLACLWNWQAEASSGWHKVWWRIFSFLAQASPSLLVWLLTYLAILSSQRWRNSWGSSCCCMGPWVVDEPWKGPALRGTRAPNELCVFGQGLRKRSWTHLRKSTESGNHKLLKFLDSVFHNVILRAHLEDPSYRFSLRRSQLIQVANTWGPRVLMQKGQQLRIQVTHNGWETRAVHLQPELAKGVTEMICAVRTQGRAT